MLKQNELGFSMFLVLGVISFAGCANISNQEVKEPSEPPTGGLSESQGSFVSKEPVTESSTRIATTKITNEYTNANTWNLEKWSHEVAQQFAIAELVFRRHRIAEQILPELDRIEAQLHRDVLNHSHHEFNRRLNVLYRVREKWKRELRAVRSQLQEQSPNLD